MYQSVTRPVEEELSGVPGLIYFESTSDSSARIAITITFEPGTPIGEAQVEVQNRIRRVEPRLPRPMAQQGMRLERDPSSSLMIVTLTPTAASAGPVGLRHHLSRNRLAAIGLIEGDRTRRAQDQRLQ